MTERSGPLVGVKVLEILHSPAAPDVGGRLSRLGAEVLQLQSNALSDAAQQGRRVVRLDLGRPAGGEACLKLAERADILLDGLGAGGLEGLDLAPEIALARNPALVCVRFDDAADADALAFGALAALLRARDTGQGQVVELTAAGPGFSLTPGAAQAGAPDADARQTLSDWGLEPEEIAALERQGVL